MERTIVYFLGVVILIIGTILFFFNDVVIAFISFEPPSYEDFASYQAYLNAFSQYMAQQSLIFKIVSLLKVFGIILWIIGASIMIYAIVLLKSEAA